MCSFALIHTLQYMSPVVSGKPQRCFTGVCDVLVNECSHVVLLMVKFSVCCSTPFYLALLFPLPLLGMVTAIIELHLTWSPSVAKAAECYSVV